MLVCTRAFRWFSDLLEWCDFPREIATGSATPVPSNCKGFIKFGAHFCRCALFQCCCGALVSRRPARSKWDPSELNLGSWRIQSKLLPHCQCTLGGLQRSQSRLLFKRRCAVNLAQFRSRAPNWISAVWLVWAFRRTFPQSGRFCWSFLVTEP